jgi:hypothetical protein
MADRNVPESRDPQDPLEGDPCLEIMSAAMGYAEALQEMCDLYAETRDPKARRVLYEALAIHEELAAELRDEEQD